VIRFAKEEGSPPRGKSTAGMLEVMDATKPKSRPFDMASLMRPRAIGIIGASPRETSAGWRVMRNLIAGGFEGSVFPINPRHAEVMGLPCYPSIDTLPEMPDAVFIGIPAEQVPPVLDRVGQAGIKAAVINASGFADGGPEGKIRQEAIQEVAAVHGMAVCGPNNTGFINLVARTFLCTWPKLPNLRPGSVALITQSGSVAIAMAQEELDLGLAYVITVGNQAVCSTADYLEYILSDPTVRVVAMHVEAVPDPERLAQAALKAIRRKLPIIALKTGITEAGRAAVAAHTGGLAGDDAVYDAFFRKYGIVRVHDFDELVEAARLFSFYPDPPRTRHVVPVAFSGGQVGVIADRGTELGLNMPQYSPQTLVRLKASFPPFADLRNPLDAWGLGWDQQRFADMIEALAGDDAIGVIVFALDMPEHGGADTFLAREMLPIVERIAPTTGARFVWLNNLTGGGYHAEMAQNIKRAGFPYLRGLRTALSVIAKWSVHLGGANLAHAPRETQVARISSVAATQLAEPERFKLLANAGIAMCSCIRVGSLAEAISAARDLGFPVVLKATSPDWAHKTELDLVRTGLRDAGAVAGAFNDLASRLRSMPDSSDRVALILQPMVGPGIELIIGVRNDEGFGSIVVAGLGGIMVDVLHDAAVEIGPVTVAQARAMLERTRAGTILAGIRGRGPYDIDAASAAIAALSLLGEATQGVLAAIEVNPLIVLPKGSGAVGVDVLLEGAPQRVSGSARSPG